MNRETSPNAEDQEYVQLLELLFNVVNEVKAHLKTFPDDDDRGWYADGLATKFFAHIASIAYLALGTKFQVSKTLSVDTIDPGSIEVLCRTAIETLLIFHHIYCAGDENTASFRYLSWRVGGLVERQLLPEPVAQEHVDKLELEKELLLQLTTALRRNPVYQALSSHRKKQITKRGEWRIDSWKTIAKDLGWSDVLAKNVYRFLSGYSHSSSLSVLQIKQAVNRQEQSSLPQSVFDIPKIVTADFVYEYLKLFPVGEGALAKKPDATKIAYLYHKAGQNLGGEI